MRKRLLGSLSTVMLLSTLLTGLALRGQPAFANLAGSNFESNDGNLVVNTTGNKDWENAPNRITGIDKPSGSTDNSFGQGTKEDVPNVTVVTGGIPNNKSDLTRFYVSSEHASSTDYLYLAWERANTLGSANIDFELNQASSGPVPTSGSWTINRTAGDLLITFDFTQGGSKPTLGLLKWVTSGATSQCFSSSALPCWGNRVNLSAAGLADGAVNDGFSVTDPINPGPPRTLASEEFGEAAINLSSAVFANLPAGTCEFFGKAFVKSRSSASFTAEVKDFIAPVDVGVSNCAALTVTKTPDAPSVSSGQPIGFTITTANNSAITATGVTLSDPLPTGTGLNWSISPAYAGPGSCSISGTAPAQQTLNCSFGDLAPGTSVSVHVSSPTTAGTSGTFVNTATARATNAPPATGTGQTTVNKPNLVVTKTPDAPSVSSGQPIGFTVATANTGQGTATGVTLSDPLPTGTGLNWSISPAYAGPGSCSISGTAPAQQTLNCSFGDLAPGTSVSVHVSSPTTAGTSGTFVNTATAQSANNPPTTGTGQTSVLQPALHVVKTADASPVSAGDSIGFTLTVTNTGPGTATGVTLSDPLPAGSGLNWSISPAYAGPGSCSISGTAPAQQTLNCSFGDVAPNASPITVHVSSPTSGATSGTFVNTATVRATNNPPATGSDSVTVNSPALAVTKTADASPVSSGDPIGFTVTVSNGGAGTARSVTLSDPLPAGSGLNWSISPAYAGPGSCSISGTAPAQQTLNCSFGDLAPSVAVSVHVSSPTTAGTSGTFVNTATARATNNPPVSGSASVTVNQPHLTLAKTADQATVTPGSAIGFAITTTNTGQGAARSVTLSDPLPTGTGLNWSISPPYAGPGSCSISGTAPAQQTLNCSFGDLAPDTRVSVHVSSPTVAPTAISAGTCGAFTNTASVSGANTTGPTAASATVTVDCFAVLHVSKTACPAPTVAPGGTLTYTISFSNSGTGPATGTTLVDTVPPGTVVRDSGGGTVGSSGGSTTVTWNVGTVGVQGSGTRTLVLDVPTTTPSGTTLVNTVAISSPDARPNTVTFTSDPVTVSTAGQVASGRAFGVSAILLGGTPLAQTVVPTPDTDKTNPATLATLDLPGTTPPNVHAELLSVVNTPTTTSSSSSDEAIATTANVAVNLPGITVAATAVKARSASDSDAHSAGSSFSGSEVDGLVINGVAESAVITQPRTFTIVDPVTQQPTAEVDVLVSHGTGAADGTTREPESGFFRSGLSIEGIHVVLLGTAAHTEATVAHAESLAVFPSGLGCGITPASVRGNAYVLDTPGINQPNNEAQVGLVVLPTTGSPGVDATVTSLPPLGVGTGTTHTDGTVSPLHAFSSAEVNGLNFLGGLITADNVKATSTTDSGTSTGTTTITNLTIGGTKVCTAVVDLSGVCTPAANRILLIDNGTVLVMLNEQLPGTGELQVNAVHIWVVGAGNPLNLPVGAQVVISHAFSGTSPGTP